MKELQSWGFENKMEKYAAMRNSNGSISRTFEDGDLFAFDAWMLYEDIDGETGDVKTLLALRHKTAGLVYTTISETFIREFMGMVEFFDEGEFDTVKIVHGVSKAGRGYVSCEIA